MSNKHLIEKKIEGSKWKNALDKSFEKNIKSAKIDGFRKGKCPRNIFEKKVGIEALYDDAVNYLLSELYTEVLNESNLEPIIKPSIDIRDIDKDSVTIAFTITTAPEVSIKKYKGLKVKKEKIEIPKEEIDEEIEKIRSQFAEISLKDGEIENGDTAVIDFVGYKNGIEFEGGKGENYPLEIGSHTFIPGFEEQLIGLKTGDEKDIKVTFPIDYPSEELCGCEVTFNVTIHEVKTRIIPELNDDFFDDLNIEGVTDEKSLIENTREKLKSEKEEVIDNKFVEDLLAKIAEETTVELESEEIDDEINRMINNYKYNLEMRGLSLEQYIKLTNSTMDMLKEQLKDEATKNVKYRYMLDEISKLENITLTDEEVDTELDKLAKEYQITKEELENEMGGVENFKYNLILNHTIDFLKKNN